MDKQLHWPVGLAKSQVFVRIFCQRCILSSTRLSGRQSTFLWDGPRKKNKKGIRTVPRLLTFSDAAAQCRCDEGTLRKAAEDGHLLVVFGCDGPGSDRIRLGDLEAYRLRLKLARHASDSTDDCDG